jgi:hypothetical protein
MPGETFVVEIRNLSGNALHGIGILIAGDLVLTCAHVVNEALGRVSDSEAQPPHTVSVHVTFPFREGSSTTGRVLFWHPPKSSLAVKDLCVLSLKPAVASQLKPARFAPAKRSTRFKAYHRTGPQSPNGWVYGTIGDRTTDGLFEVHKAKDTPNFFVPGCSGGPAISSKTGRVLGMIVWANPDSGSGHIAPSQLLERATEFVKSPDGRKTRGIRATEAADEPPDSEGGPVADQRVVGSSPPPMPAALTGRETELNSLVEALLADEPLPIPILGPAGIGKSTLALAALLHDRVVEKFKGRCFFVDCEKIRSAYDLPNMVASAMGFPPGRVLGERSPDGAAPAPAALVLDNFETPWEAQAQESEAFLKKLAARSNKLALVVTLRGGELPWAGQWGPAIRLLPLSREASTKAFLDVAGRHFEHDPDLQRLLPALDGHPLSIYLLAAQVQAQQTLEYTLTEYKMARTRMLQGKNYPQQDRRTSLGASLELSINGHRMRANPNAQKLLSILSLLPAGISTSELRALFPHLASAANTLLRVALAYDTGHRIRVLTPIRDHVVLEHPPSDEERQKVAHYFAELLQTLAADDPVRADVAANSDALNTTDQDKPISKAKPKEVISLTGEPTWAKDFQIYPDGATEVITAHAKLNPPRKALLIQHSGVSVSHLDAVTK